MAETLTERERLKVRLLSLRDRYAAEKKNNRGSLFQKRLKAQIETLEARLVTLSDASVQPSIIRVDPDIGL